MGQVSSLGEWRDFLSDFLTSRGVAWAVGRAAADDPLPFAAHEALEYFGFDALTAKALRYGVHEVFNRHSGRFAYVRLVDDGRLAWLGAAVSSAFGLSPAATQGIADAANLAVAIASPVLPPRFQHHTSGDAGGYGAVLTRHATAFDATTADESPDATAMAAAAAMEVSYVLECLELVREGIQDWHPLVLRKRLWIPNHLALEVDAARGDALRGAQHHLIAWLLLEMLHTRCCTRLRLLAQVPAAAAGNQLLSDADATAARFRNVHGAAVIRE